MPAQHASVIVPHFSDAATGRPEAAKRTSRRRTNKQGEADIAVVLVLGLRLVRAAPTGHRAVEPNGTVSILSSFEACSAQQPIRRAPAPVPAWLALRKGTAASPATDGRPSCAGTDLTCFPFLFPGSEALPAFCKRTLDSALAGSRLHPPPPTVAEGSTVSSQHLAQARLNLSALVASQRVLIYNIALCSPPG